MDCSDAGCLQLSVVMPAFNEAARISATIEDLVANMPADLGTAWELIVVDDGSCDSTLAVVGRYADCIPSLRTLQHSVNQGKGAAVRSGVLAAKGRYVMFCDADGATPFGEASKLLAAMQTTENGVSPTDVAIGTRIRGSSVRRSPLRCVMAWTFRFAVRRLVGVRVADTQCGFKMFDREVAQRLFSASLERGYLFDVEILGLATAAGFTISEVPVRWNEVAGSRVRLIRDSVSMFVGLIRVRKAILQRARDSGTTNQPNILNRTLVSVCRIVPPAPHASVPAAAPNQTVEPGA